MRTLVILVAVMVMTAPVTADKQKAKNNTITKPPVGVELAAEPSVVIGGVKITLGEAIKLAIKQNYDILAGSYDVAMADTYYQQFQKKYSIFLNAEGGYAYNRYPDSLALLQGKKAHVLDMQVALAKMFSSGTMVSAGMQHTYTNKTLLQFPPEYGLDSSMFGPADSNMPVFFVSVQQELLKNFLGHNDRRLEKQLKNATAMQKEQVVAMLSMVLVGVIADYWDLTVKKIKVENAELNLKETRNVRNIIGRNVRLGLADGFTINYYNMLVAGAEASLVQAKQEYRNARRKFLSTINMSSDVSVDGKVFLTNSLPPLNEAAALKSAYEKRADYLAARLTLKNAKMELEIQKNKGLPSLTAEVNVSTMGYDKSFGTAYGDAGKFSYPGIEARLKLSYPLDDREQKINERNAHFKIRQAKINLNKTKRTVRDEIKTAIETIQTSYALYKKGHTARIQAEAFYYRMLRNLRRGRLDSATVKNGIDAMISTRQQELEALIYFNLSLLQYEVAMNKLWDRYDINVDHYIPKDKK